MPADDRASLSTDLTDTTDTQRVKPSRPTLHLPAAASALSHIGDQGAALAQRTDDRPLGATASGADLLDAICVVVRRHLVLPDHAAEAIALWVLHAWAFDAWKISPILIIMSPVKGCGKTTLLSVISWLVPLPEFVSSATAASVFRLIEDSRPDVPTLLLDEADTYLKPHRQDLRGIINSGWIKTGASVLRADGGKTATRRYSTWAPKAIATIKKVADTLMDRAVIVSLRRKAATEVVERFKMHDTADFASLRHQMRGWARDNSEALERADPAVPAGLQNRAADNWAPLIAIADCAGGSWPEISREAAVQLSRVDDDDPEIELLRDVRRVFEQTDETSIGAQELVRRLTALEESRWAEPGHRLTAKRLALMLQHFEIRSVKIRGPRQYRRADFEPAWAAYLPNGASGEPTVS
jgi:hypothetical protein